ncbi:ribonucleoside-diphosphate reductase, adenosylcobalamin-dependent [Candidatus Collierbacteria bacterium CG17_big_fil_post_rev_8_21_14_2_50_45_7]|uniref:Vitamin B12-dependent ribonucleotide reductase n=2 Tax=Candidatus Collieribacteriota TaxID=1752725 RepID=A0A2M7FL98_9BACT|nr:MAG: ribonucleoside-diphosphate reductase, adenosylcobalamin-dependent [Candidatus Collierbacteria bacterium CG17_big_fil_post_rev_8_21_14_2_50_45_7]
MTKPKIIEPRLTKNALEVAKKRYLRTDMEGKVVETVGEMLWRVAYHMAKPEVTWGTNGIVMEMANKFYERMSSLKMVCAGKAMFEAGNPGGTGQLSSCFVLPIEDSIGEIFKTLGEAAVVHKNNGGTGFNFSKIRPHGDKVKNVPGAASGPVDFLRAYSAALSQILQGAKRQGANIGILNVNHPDIESFIELKDADGTIKNFNVSVGVTDAFMNAVVEDKYWNLVNPRNGEVAKRLKAKTLFNKIAQQAWKTGDPGLIFLDTMEKGNTVPGFGKLDAVNPCGEVTLFPYESCNLTSIDLARHLKNNKIDWEELKETVRLGVRFLDNMIEVNTYPVPEIEATVKNGNRRIGLGVMGFAHLLYKMRIPYNSDEAVKLARDLSKFIYENAAEMSSELAEARGNFPNWDLSIYPAKGQPMRNCAVTMIAPTGTISILANTSSGIEPVFSLVTIRRTFYEDDKSNHSTKEFLMVDPVFEEYIGSRKNILDQVASGDYSGLSVEEKRLFVTTHQISPSWHVKIQAAWQKYFDNSISKTVNFGHDATVDDVKETYMLAWKLGCKGVTIYRDGSKQDQVLVSNNQAPITNNQTDGVCPECGGKLHKQDGCSKCIDCGYSVCG